MGNSPEHYFKTQKAISKIIGVILNGDFIQSHIRYTIIFAIGCVDHFGFCIIILFTVYHIVIKSMHTKVYSIPTTTTTDRAYVCNITP